MLKAGIVGLPNVGKSTLFNAVTRTRKAQAANYPFCTIDPNVGVVTVPDERLYVLQKIAKTTVVIPAAIEFVDIAGLVKGASAGEGLGNKFLTLASNAFTNLNLTDMETCYKVFRREVLKRISVEENRFGFEPEITAKVAKLGVRIYEVGISYDGRTYEEGKKIGWKDGVRALWCIVKYNWLR